MGSAILAWDAQAVLDMFRMHNSPFYAIFEGKETILYAQSDDDENIAEQRLRETLKYIEDSGSAALFTLRIYNDGDKISNKKEYRGTIPFKLNQYEMGSTPNRGRAQADQQIVVLGDRRQPTAQVPPGVEDKLSKLIEQNHLLLQHFILQKDEGEYDDEEEDTETPGEIDPQEKILQQAERVTNSVTQLLSIPAINGLFSGLVNRFFPANNNIGNQNFLPQNTQQMGNNAGIGNAPTITDEQVKEALTRIVTLIGDEQWRNALVQLGNMAVNDPNRLNFALSMLK